MKRETAWKRAGQRWLTCRHDALPRMCWFCALMTPWTWVWGSVFGVYAAGRIGAGDDLLNEQRWAVAAVIALNVSAAGLIVWRLVWAQRPPRELAPRMMVGEVVVILMRVMVRAVAALVVIALGVAAPGWGVPLGAAMVAVCAAFGVAVVQAAVLLGLGGFAAVVCGIWHYVEMIGRGPLNLLRR